MTTISELNSFSTISYKLKTYRFSNLQGPGAGSTGQLFNKCLRYFNSCFSFTEVEAVMMWRTALILISSDPIDRKSWILTSLMISQLCA